MGLLPSSIKTSPSRPPTRVHCRGMSRVAIVDYDVHHGNGTQHIFEDEYSEAVLYTSRHTSIPFLIPGSWRAWTKWAGAPAAEFTVNLPLEVGAVGDGETIQPGVSDDVIVPVLEQFSPELLIISAGFVTHNAGIRWPGMRLKSTAFFGAMTAPL